MLAPQCAAGLGGGTESDSGRPADAGLCQCGSDHIPIHRGGANNEEVINAFGPLGL